MTTSCGGVSFRMWDSHACHSAGTCEALRSCYEKGSISGSAHQASRSWFSDEPGQSRPNDDDLIFFMKSRGERRNTEKRTRYFLLCVEILEITVSEPAE